MAYRRYRGYRRRPGYRRSYRSYRRRRVGASTKRYVKRAISRATETKWLTWPYDNLGAQQVNLGSVGYSSSSVYTSLCAGIPPGYEIYNRIGREIVVTGLNIRLALEAGDTYNFLRIVVFTPRSNVQMPVGINDLISHMFSNINGAATVHAPIDTTLYRPFFDRKYRLRHVPVDGSTTSTYPLVVSVNKTLRLRKKIKWVGLDVVSDIHVIAISDSSVMPNPGAIAGRFKLFFKDG